MEREENVQLPFERVEERLLGNIRKPWKRRHHCEDCLSDRAQLCRYESRDSQVLRPRWQAGTTGEGQGNRGHTWERMFADGF